MRNGATTLAVAMLSKPWKTVGSTQRTFIRCSSSFMKSLTSVLLRRRRTTTKIGNTDLGPTWPEVWRRTKGQHSLPGAVLSLFPTGTMREILAVNHLLIRVKPKPSIFRGKALCWKVLRRYSLRRKRKSGKRRLNAVFMRCSASTEGPAIPRPDHRQHCPSGLSMV